ncbi:NF-kappa-B inhibitor zeta [Hyperolius riggenbachi]|uniref:NF-kappa-B inhibitor zeta n=1 Tax=Hyperolius riggenbachi TaxID=752182 RepID=UPI0035A3B2C9
MIAEWVMDDSLDFLEQDHMISSPVNLGCFYAESYSPPSSDVSSSPSHSLSSGPGSPASDSEGSLSASCSRSKKGQGNSVGRQSRGSFQGVRVKNSVRELLNQMRSKSRNGVEEFQMHENSDQYTELKNILNRKRPVEFMTDAPAAKKPCHYLSSSYLTPPSTPKSCEIMDETSKSDINPESNRDLLQSIINIKNESTAVSLNTVQVNWTNMTHHANTQEHFYQEFPVTQTFSPAQTNQAFSSSPSHNDQYQYGCPQVQNIPPQCSEFKSYPEVHNYPEVESSNDVLQSCAIESYLSLIEAPREVAPPNMAMKPNMQAQTFSPPLNPSCNQFVEFGMVQSSSNVSPPLCHTDVGRSSPLQIGKSFFHWQIEQEEKKLANVTHEQLLSKDTDGDTWLHLAVAHGKRALSYVLACKMASLNMLDAKEHNNQSALQVAVAANHHLIVQDLMSLGAQVNTTDHWGRTPLHVCATKGFPQVLQAIQKGIASSNQYIDVDVINYEVHETSDSRQCCLTTDFFYFKDRKSGRTALHLACEEANLELMSLFLDLANSLDFINTKAYNGNTALHVAASLQYRRAHVGAVKLLMRKGADPSARNLENEQPVHLVSDGPVGEEIRRVLKGKSMQQRLPSY